MTDIWSSGSRFSSWTDYKKRRTEQTSFGQKGGLEKSIEQRPMPNWQAKHEENIKLAITRRLADKKKEEIFAHNPRATLYTFFGDAIINEKWRRFTFDVDISKLNATQKALFVKDTWEKIYFYWLPANNYYAVFSNPRELNMSGSIHHDGLIGMLHGRYVKGKERESTQSWTPKLSIKPQDWKIYLEVRKKILAFNRKQKARRELYAK